MGLYNLKASFGESWLLEINTQKWDPKMEKTLKFT